MTRHDSHEDFRRDEAVAGPPDRQFGLVFTAVFAVLGLVPLLHGGAVRWWSVLLAALFLAAALLAPRTLAPLNRIWLRFGLLLHKVVSPVVLGLVFFSTVTPIGMILRWLGKDPLRLRFEPDAATYWIERRPPGPRGDSMPRQY